MSKSSNRSLESMAGVPAEAIALQAGGPGQSNAALDVLRSLPPEAIVRVVDIIGDVLRARATMAQKQADFVAELELLRARGGDRERTMNLVSKLLLTADINEEAKMRLIDTICLLALR